MKEVREIMFTITNIVEDISRGCLAHNMVEDCFSYRVVFFVNEGGKGSKFYVDTPYNGLWKALESIIKDNLSLTNTVVIAETTALKNGKCVCLQSRAYPFNLDGYFEKISGKCVNRNNISRNVMHGRHAVR